jgi:FKBP-type peptidyl-prolyl cis-trans isomerase 2
MRFSFFFCIVFSILTSSCTVEKSKPVVVKSKKQQLKEDLNLLSNTVENDKKFNNGVRITWHAEGNGDQVKDDKIYLINYTILSKDSIVMESSISTKRIGLPYVAGWSLHTAGIDFTLSQLRVGDWVTARIPAELVVDAHGKRSKTPKDQIMKVKVVKELLPTRIIDGIRVWKLEGSSKETAIVDTNSSITINYIASSKSNPKFDESYTTRRPFTFQMYNNNVVPGLKKALINAKKHDRLLMIIPSKEAYGNKGYRDYVRPNEQLFYNISLEDVVKVQ